MIKDRTFLIFIIIAVLFLILIGVVACNRMIEEQDRQYIDHNHEG